MIRLVWYVLTPHWSTMIDRATFASFDWSTARAAKGDDDLLEGRRVEAEPGSTFRLPGATFAVSLDGTTITPVPPHSNAA